MTNLIKTTILVAIFASSSFANASFKPDLEGSKSEETSSIFRYQNLIVAMAVAAGAVLFVYGRPYLMQSMGIPKEHASPTKPCCSGHRHAHSHAEHSHI